MVHLHFLPMVLIVFNSVILDVTNDAKNENLLQRFSKQAKIELGI
jgi:hypothetical protein